MQDRRRRFRSLPTLLRGSAHPQASPRLPALLAALLALGLAAPARAIILVDESNSSTIRPYSIKDGVTDNVIVGPRGVLDIEGGGVSTVSGAAVQVIGGTLHIYGGEVQSAGGVGVEVQDGTATIYGGFVRGVVVDLRGTATIAGGQIVMGVSASNSGMVTVSGSCLRLLFQSSDGDLTNYRILGTLKDGRTISVPATTESGGQIVLDGADTTPPSLTCPADVTVLAGQCPPTLTFPAVTDNCGTPFFTAFVTVSRSDNQALDAPYPLGTTTITWTAIDLTGNHDTCQQKVTIQGAPPALSLAPPADLTLATDAGKCSASGGALGMPTVSGACGTPTISNNAPAAFPVGITTVTWKALDSLGRSVSATQMVTVTDNEPPTITAPSDLTVVADAGTCTAGHPALGTATTGDNCGVESVTNDAPANFPLGDTTVTWTVTDANGNTNTARQTVHVSAPPLGFIPGLGSATSGAGAGKAQLFLADAGKCSASLTLTPPATAGGCGMVTVTGARSDGAELTDPYPLGPTTVTWTAVDNQGSQATSTQDVTVVDRGKPAFSNCPSTAIVATATCTAKGTGALVSFSALSATDNCTGTPTINYDHKSGSFFPPGNTTVTAAAMDAAANSATCAFTVSVAYACSGFLPPINATGGSVFKAGSTVPVTFQLTGASACITTLAATFSYSKVSNGVAGAGSTSASTSGNQFRYTGGQYLYNWSTKGLTAGTYQLQINLGDGVSRTVELGLR